ncbi:MAG: HepT-like ribonuclease domain-containing protein [Moheibacter sp.]
MKSELGDKIRIPHILDAITEIEDYLKGVDYQLYLENLEKRFATIKQIEIIGKASIALIDELKEKHSEIPWKLIRGFEIFQYTNILVLTFVWEIVTSDLPLLKLQIMEINHGFE